MEARWSLEQLLGYLGTWSAVQRYKEEKGRDPVSLVARRLEKAWGPPDRKTIMWSLSVRAGVLRSAGQNEAALPSTRTGIVKLDAP